MLKAAVMAGGTGTADYAGRGRANTFQLKRLDEVGGGSEFGISQL